MSFLSQMKIKQKLPIMMVFLAILNAGVVFAISEYFANEAAVTSAQAKLVAVRSAKHQALTNYLESIEQDLSGLATNDYTREAIYAFDEAWYLLGSNQQEKLQRLYIDDNPNPTGQKEELDYAKDGSQYSAVHAKYHPWFRHFLRQKGYYDIFLFDTDGNLIYTVFKELDYATNMNDGEYKDTDLANAFRAAVENPEEGYQAFFDFEPYAPSNDAPASFISQPVLSDSGQLAGVLVFQMPIERINDTLSSTKGMGETGETFIVGQDYLMRSVSRFKENAILNIKVEEEAVKKALAGESGLSLNLDYNGNDVIVAYEPLDFNGVRWALIAEMTEAEAFALLKKQELFMALAALGVSIIVALISIFYASSLSGPIGRMVDAMKTLAGGNTDVQVPSLDRKDEIGDMASAVQVFKENAIEMKAMEEEQERLKIKAEQEKAEAMNKMAADFDARTGGLIKKLSESSANMNTTAQSMSSASNQTIDLSASVAAAATEADSNVQTVASAAEELAASSSEIARQIDDVSQRASQAADDAQETSKSVEELNTLADSIGEVVNAIKEIAEQTNLLALNATIEAARAGEAGKGFAVVADEVKKLAMETAQKTDEIDGRVVNIQNAIRASVEAMNRIISNVQQIDSATASVASAVEEQNAATAEIGRNVTEATAGTSQVSQSITEVQKTAENSGESSKSVLTASEELSEVAKNLQSEINAFLAEIRNDSAKKDKKAEKSSDAVDEVAAADDEGHDDIPQAAE